MNTKGFSLVELVVILSIIGILLTITAIDFHSWQVNRAIEKQAKQMEADFQKLRLTSIYQKKQCQVSMDGDTYVFKSYSSEFDGIGTPVPTGNSAYQVRTNGGDVTFDARGFSNVSSQTYWIVPTGSGAACDCLVLSQAKINMGKMQNDGKCLLK